MNMTVYCGASAGKDPIFSQKASALGSWLAAHDITLVYGGGRTGLMGILADAVLEGGGSVIGVIPEFLKTPEEVHTSLTQLITVETMRQRKDTMLRLGDAFLALPGGAGTLEEIVEAISFARLGQHDKPCMLYNIGGYYDYLEKLFGHMEDRGFLTERVRKKAQFVTSIADIADRLHIEQDVCR